MQKNCLPISSNEIGNPFLKPVSLLCFLGNVKAFDRHFNMVLTDVKIMWMYRPKKKKGQEKRPDPILKDTFKKCIFLRGDNIILVLKKPKEQKL